MGVVVGNVIIIFWEEIYQVEEYYVKIYFFFLQYEYIFFYEFLLGLRIINLCFIDDNCNYVIDVEEDSKLVFDVVNDGDVFVYNVILVIEEMSGMKYILILFLVQIVYMFVGNQIRYMVIICGGRKLKIGQV